MPQGRTGWLLARQEAIQGFELPPLPEARFEGSHRRWGLIAAGPILRHPKGDIVVNEEWIDTVMVNFARLTSGGFDPPVKAQHLPSLDGGSPGWLIGLAKWFGPTDLTEPVSDANPLRPYMLAALELTKTGVPNAEERINAGEFRWLSMGLGGRDDEFNQDLWPVVTEVSLVQDSHHTRLGPTHIFNTGDGMAFVNQEDGRWVVRRGDPDFEVLSTWDTEAEATDEMERLHRDNDPRPQARGAAAKRRWEESMSSENSSKTAGSVKLASFVNSKDGRFDVINSSGEIRSGGLPTAELAQQVADTFNAQEGFTPEQSLAARHDFEAQLADDGDEQPPTEPGDDSDAPPTSEDEGDEMAKLKRKLAAQDKRLKAQDKQLSALQDHVYLSKFNDLVFKDGHVIQLRKADLRHWYNLSKAAPAAFGAIWKGLKEPAEPAANPAPAAPQAPAQPSGAPVQPVTNVIDYSAIPDHFRPWMGTAGQPEVAPPAAAGGQEDEDKRLRAEAKRISQQTGEAEDICLYNLQFPDAAPLTG